jgi:RimJ/RimL family protein N-acetyltransferase
MVEHSEKVDSNECREITIRTMEREDLDLLFAFYQRMPEEEKELMQVDVRDRAVVKSRYEEMIEEGHERLIAICDDTGELIGEAVLENLRLGWLRKTGGLRIRILPAYRTTVFAGRLMREIFLLAARHGMNNVICHVLHDDEDMLGILKELNFTPEATLKNHAVDMHDNPHDVFVLTFSLRKMWQALEETVRKTDSFHREY